MSTSGTPLAWLATDAEEVRRSIATRHRIFCRGEAGSEALEDCSVSSPGDYHDDYDPRALHFGVDYNGQSIMTARLILGTRLAVMPTGRLLGRLEQPPAVNHHHRYSEPSRLGLSGDFQGTEVGRKALLSLVGLLTETSVLQGFDSYLLSLRGVLMRAFSWFPWTLAPPIDYPASEGGPNTAEPMWLATLNLHELVVATRMFNSSAYQMMFDDRPAWFDPTLARSQSELRELVRSNRIRVRRANEAWKTGQLTLAKLAPIV
ncbi:hypothetical protein HJC99_00565 [Candidatus Saccharibacteria bacterium]|nr:hypothetical protein [Candidatus Saccharibacteria bacterium]